MRGLLALAGLVWAAGAGAQDARFRPDERVVLREFSFVRAVAATQRLVFGATDRGLIVRDVPFRRWLPPRTALDGYPEQVVRAAYADPVEDALWLGTDRGLTRYIPQIERFEHFDVPGGVRAIGADPSDPAGDLWLYTAAGWARMPRGGVFPIPGGSPPARLQGSIGLDQLRGQYPFVDAMATQVLTDDRMRTDRFTDAARVPGTEVFWLGTTSRGLIRLDALVAEFEPQPFGLLADGVAAFVQVPDGFWVLTDGFGRRQGLSFFTRDLDRWQWDEGPPVTGFGASVFRAVLARGQALWIASDRGLWRVEPQASHRLFTMGSGLPDESVYALAQGPSGLWIGTALGLALMADDDSISIVDYQRTVLALSAARDTAWVGTTVGLGLAWPGSGGIRVPPDVAAVPELRSPVLALARTADTIVAVTPDRIAWREGAGGPWHVERMLSPEIGVLRAAVGDDGGVWVGAGTGFAWFDYRTRAFQVFAGPTFAPGSVRALGVDREYLWVGTEAGLVRFRKRALRP